MPAVREVAHPNQEQTMQQRQNQVLTPVKSEKPNTPKTAKTSPVALDEKSLREVVGGRGAPNGSW
jgi:hypothetical protein